MYEQLLALRCDNRAAASASGLPAAHYTDPAHFELEKRRIFYRSWICVGHESMARAPGAWFVARVADQEVLVVRNEEGRLNAFHNACRHRGHVLASGSDAYLASSPVIAMTGGSPPRLRHRNLYQAADDLPAFAPYTKLNAALGAVERFPDLIARAFGEATSGCPGPVHLQFAGQEGEIDREVADMQPRCDARHRRVPAHRPAGGADACRRLLERLQAAERPVIVAGGGVHHSGAAGELVRLAEALQVPVATSLNGRGAIPRAIPSRSG